MRRMAASQLIDLAKGLICAAAAARRSPSAASSGRSPRRPPPAGANGRPGQRHRGRAGQRQGRDAAAPVALPGHGRCPARLPGPGRQGDRGRGGREARWPADRSPRRCGPSRNLRPWSGSCRGAGQVRVRRGRRPGQRGQRPGGPAPRPQARASDSGVDGLPTLLSNAETFAQLAVLGLLGPEGYASAGTAGRAGHGAADRRRLGRPPGGRGGPGRDPPSAPCWTSARPGWPRGSWSAATTAPGCPPRSPMTCRSPAPGWRRQAARSGPGVVLPLEAPPARSARWRGSRATWQAESSGQCGPCKLGLPGVARALTALADGSGGVGALEAARRSAGAVRGRGACHHPDGTARFVAQRARRVPRRSRRARVPRRLWPPGPRHPAAARRRACRPGWWWTGPGAGARAVRPARARTGAARFRHGFPAFLDMPVPFWLEQDAQQAVADVPGPGAAGGARRRGAAAGGGARGLPGPATGPIRRITG